METVTRRRTARGLPFAALAGAAALCVADPGLGEDEAPPGEPAAEEPLVQPPPPGPELAEDGSGWSQAAVARTSRDLQKALEALLADPDIDAAQATAMQQREHTAAIASVREIAGINEELSRRLANGYTRDETQAFWDRIALVDDDLRAYARHSWLPPDTRDRARRAGGLLDELGAYYEDEGLE